MVSRLLYFAGVLYLASGVGCGPATGSVSGEVTYKGEKVSSATLSFCVEGKVVETAVENGRYQVTGVPVGEAQVIVVRLDPNQPDPNAAMQEARRLSAEKKLKSTDPTLVPDAVQLEALQKKRHLLPYHYASPETTDLRCTIAAGPNVFDVKLMDRAKAK